MSTRTQEIRRRILQALKGNSMTCYELTRCLGEPSTSVAPRLAELHCEGRVWPTGAHRTAPGSTVPGAVFRVVEGEPIKVEKRAQPMLFSEQ